MFNIYDFYEKMEDGKIMLSFKGEITADLLTSILHIMESKLDTIGEEPKLKKKVYNVLVECLQNLYHHNEASDKDLETNSRSALFLIGRSENNTYKIITGNYILNENVDSFREKLDKINSLSKDGLKEFYMDTLNNHEYSEKGGGGLGMIDIARKSGQKIEYSFESINQAYSFFSLIIRVSN
jgi:hypothetical protein